MDLENSIYGYLHERGEIVPKEDKQIQYKGGQQKGMYIGQRMSYVEFVSKACERLDINSNGYTFHYTLEFDPSALQQLDDDEDMHMMLSHSYDYARIYVLKRTRRVEVEGDVECSSQPSMRGRRGARIIEQRLVDINPGTIAEYSRQDGHFWQLFIAHSFSIQGFLMGCRPVIAIDSTHLSGPYRGSLFSATAYDADDGMFPIAFGVVSSKNYEDWLWFLQKLKGILQDKEVVIISDRHQAILHSVSQLFGVENHAYCYHHVKENFSSYVTKHRMKGKKCKMDALLLLDNVAYARLDDDYVVAMEKLKTYNSDLAKWVEENNPQHWAMSKFAKKRWDKMTTNLAESFNAWLKEERHYTIFNLVMTHMDKFAHLACDHMGSTKNWKAAIGPKTEEKLLENIIKSGSLPVYPYVGGVFKVFNMKVYVDVNLRERTCTCKAWQMAGIPCENACAAIRQMKQDVYEYVDSYFKLPVQQLIYSGHFNSIPNHNMPIVDADGCVRDAQGRLYPSLKPPCSKRPPGRPRHRRIESQFSSKRLIFCSRCQVAGHNRASCKNPLPAP
ncbi:uncharacterized protein LOC104880614 [Vitis vinifera]|uniref:uncharacterized protein LOC104880614 n=1 Tax=Vitis vinifera TaxID=29760 RepID=UPI0008FED5A8|nr:uncharacterized protein LOC104880614 [Vitis vinifera]|eukprot:XP_019078111.1 PREDICTED: uncharacterized protein LOC104880614 [Vitis vinifera]